MMNITDPNVERIAKFTLPAPLMQEKSRIDLFGEEEKNTLTVMLFGTRK